MKAGIGETSTKRVDQQGEQYEYFIWPERKILLRVSASAVEQFCPEYEEKWQISAAMDGIRTGNGDFDYFKRIGADEAASWCAARCAAGQL